MTVPDFTDILAIGAGPVGCLWHLGLRSKAPMQPSLVRIAFCSNQVKHHILAEPEVVVLEKRSLAMQEQFGRACTLYLCTIELLELFGVAGEIVQNAFTGQTYAAYSRGKHMTTSAWQTMLPMMGSSFHNYITNIHQNNSQRIFASKY